MNLIQSGSNTILSDLGTCKRFDSSVRLGTSQFILNNVNSKSQKLSCSVKTIVQSCGLSRPVLIVKRIVIIKSTLLLLINLLLGCIVSLYRAIGW